MKMGVRLRIYVGFIATALITLTIILYSIYSQDFINAQNLGSRTLEEEARKILAINIHAANLTGTAEQYRLAPNADQTAAMEQARHAIEQEAQQRSVAALSDEHRRIYVQIHQIAQAMRPELERLSRPPEA